MMLGPQWQNSHFSCGSSRTDSRANACERIFPREKFIYLHLSVVQQRYLIFKCAAVELMAWKRTGSEIFILHKELVLSLK